MKPAPFWQRKTSIVLLCCACVIPLPALSLAISAADEGSANRVQALTHDRIHLAQGRQCETRMGPFVTQETAWQRWRQARSQGRAVSQSVVPCHGQGIRGYCFFVFHAC